MTLKYPKKKSKSTDKNHPTLIFNRHFTLDCINKSFLMLRQGHNEEEKVLLIRVPRLRAAHKRLPNLIIKAAMKVNDET